MLDGVEPDVIDEIRHAAGHVDGVREVNEVRARWICHRLAVDANIAVDPGLTVAQGHAIGNEVNHQLHHHLAYVSWASIHVDSTDEAGESHHHIHEHAHDGLPAHSHGLAAPAKAARGRN